MEGPAVLLHCIMDIHERSNTSDTASSPICQMRLAFVMDQQVGLRTQALNLERVVSEDSAVSASYIAVNYVADAGFLSRLPGLPSGMRGTLRGVREIQDGLEGRDVAVTLWATWAAKSVPKLVAANPAIFVMDMTPVQMEGMGELYGYGRRRARLFAGLKRRATDRIYRMASHFFPWSQFVANSLEQDYGIDRDRITVMSPGVDLELYVPRTRARAADGQVRLLFVGGDFRRKGGDLILRWARERLERGRNGFEIHMVTRDEALEAETGVIVHRGIANNSPELVDLYQNSDIFVLPTRADCYSFVAMEAMATGLPVVISDIGGISDIVSEGETGFLIAPGDYGSLTDRLDQLVDNPGIRARMGIAARLRAERRFNCRANVKQILDRMKSLAGTNLG